MELIPSNTLAYYEALASKRHLKLDTRMCAVMAKATLNYKKSASEVSPDVRALEFYATNHCYSKLLSRFTRNEPLPDWAKVIAKAYELVLTEQGERLMHYLIYITTREIRHLPSSELTGMKAKVVEAGGEDFFLFMKKILGMSEYGAIDHFLTEPPPMSIGKYVRTLEYLFDNGWGEKTSFGGKAWGSITRCLGDFLHGKTSLEMMVDTSYTLAHNNGPMFNKGLMYSMYTQNFIKLLDVQRAGMIPELVHTASDYKWASFTPKPLKELVALCYQNMPEEFGEFVDWEQVKKLGAMSNVSGEIADQAKKQQAKPKAAMFMGKPAIAVGQYQVMPHETATIFQRKAA